MTETTLLVVDGPDKPALQWSVAYPERNVAVHFVLEGDAVDAQIQEMSEINDGSSFRLKGRFVSGAFKGIHFTGIYSLASRAGSLKIVT